MESEHTDGPETLNVTTAAEPAPAAEIAQEATTSSPKDTTTQSEAAPVMYAGPRPDSDPYRDDDSAIEDYSSTNSVSLDSSNYEYRHEYGRRYHAQRQDAEYHLPNDETELDRLDLQHACFLLTLSGRLHRAPIPLDVQHVLDVGCGTGIWAIDFADNYTSAMVTGTDLSPVQPSYVPPNCRFYVENAEQPWTFEHKFDYIHMRMLVIAIKDWKKLFAQAFDGLKPGGYIELQDMNFPARCDDDSAPPDSPLMRWSSLMMEASRNLGVDLSISNQFPVLLSEAGFVDINVETYAWPCNRWPKDKTLKKLGIYVHENFCQGLQAFSMAFFSRGLQWKPEDINALVEQVIPQSKDLNSHVYSPISFFWARKPLAYDDSENA